MTRSFIAQLFKVCRAFFSRSASQKPDGPQARTRLGLETLEQRDTPAVLYSYSAGLLRVWFDNAPAASAGPGTPQATTISSYQGNVTLNFLGYEKTIKDARNQPIKAANVTNIVVDGSSQPNFIDLRYVSPAAGFKSTLNGHIMLRGHGGNDVLIGSQFDDRIRGGDGFDQVDAGDGHDWLAGDAGDDWLYGGYGNDVYQGGTGRDWFDRFHAGDRVTDFYRAQDFYEPIGLAPEVIAMDKALRDRLLVAKWYLGDEK